MPILAFGYSVNVIGEAVVRLPGSDFRILLGLTQFPGPPWARPISTELCTRLRWYRREVGARPVRDGRRLDVCLKIKNGTTRRWWAGGECVTRDKTSGSIGRETGAVFLRLGEWVHLCSVLRRVGRRRMSRSVSEIREILDVNACRSEQCADSYVCYP
jgi:hypothetical protein